MKLTAISDEIGNNVNEIIDALITNDLHYVELRKIDNKRLTEYTYNELDNIYKRFKKNGIRVSCIDTNIGKKENAFDEKRNESLIIEYLSIAKIFRCKYIRIFSDISNIKSFDSIERKLGKYSSLAKEYGIVVLVENEKNTMLINPVQINWAQFDNIKLLFDNENCEYYNLDSVQILQEVTANVRYIHLRDCCRKTGQYTYLTKGDLRIQELVNVLHTNKFKGFVCLESLLPLYIHDKSKSEILADNLQYLLKLVNL